MGSVDIEILGEKHTIEFLDDLPWGETQKILTRCVDITNPSAVKVNISLYQQMVLSAAVTKAPIDFKTTMQLNQLPTKTVITINNAVMKLFPLETLVKPWITAMTGEDSIESLMKSTHTVP